MGRRVDREDGGEVDVAQEDVEQEEHEGAEILKWSPAPDMLQDVIEVLDCFG